jgi:hypothetical protein
MFNNRLIAVLCLILLAGTLLVLGASDSIVWFLPLFATLSVVIVSTAFVRLAELPLHPSDPALFPFSLRAPPRQ